MLKKSYEKSMSESLYLFTLLEKMKNPELFIKENESCSICFDNLDNPAITPCGHIFCYDCLKMCLTEKNKCPMCKSDIAGKELLIVNKKQKSDVIEETNPLIAKYGSKLGKTISLIRHIISQPNTRIIIFSQWDDMLNLIGKTLSENGVENSFVKGNAHMRNSAISKFKIGKNNSGDDNKVIMLSLKNSASGTNLTEATHIIFIEPINSPSTECKSIEGQAIGRACRVGQKNKVIVLRILIADSIEETIYKKSYNKDVQVKFENELSIMNDLINQIEYKTEETKEEIVKPKKIIKKKSIEV
jgi:SNF2 family DNA or RNA helicase